MILYYECRAGISGDMNLGALVDLGMDFNVLKSELAKLSLPEEYEITLEKASKYSIYGSKVSIRVLNDSIPNDDSQHSHSHRKFSDIKKIILKSRIAKNAKNIAIKIFEKLAFAEGSVHNLSPDDVHFHEVGATDSILDIVGAAICFEHMQVEKIYFSELEVGKGFVRAAHGKMPVPAPATLKLIEGMNITNNINCEATTPTGAAILNAMNAQYLPSIDGVIMKSGIGVGDYDFDIPNILRIFELEMPNQLPISLEKQFLIEANIDDMSPELLAHAETKLLNAGALDVFRQSILMKKSRLGVKISALCSTESLESVGRALIQNTSSIGYRVIEISKYASPRNEITIKQDGDTFRIKTTDNTIKTEYESLKKLSDKMGFETLKKTNEKFSGLIEYLERLSPITLAYSGGIDSSFLAYCLSRSNAQYKAVTICPPYYPSFEKEASIKIANNVGINQLIVDMDFARALKNSPEDRCYICKGIMLDKIKELAEQDTIIDGTNADDLKEDRPGLRALNERGVIKPLAENNISKNEVISWSRLLGILEENRSSYSCLLTRIPENILINNRLLRIIEDSEIYMFELGYSNFHVDIEQTGDKYIAIIRADLRPEDFGKISRRLKEIGFYKITLNLEG